MKLQRHTIMKCIAESDRAHNHSWSDVSELNYWGRILNFQRPVDISITWHLEEVKNDNCTQEGRCY